MIENPESHLHPSAQTRMGEFLSRAANEGIQIIIETHSDHLMNGIRIACRNGIITQDKIEMDFDSDCGEQYWDMYLMRQEAVNEWEKLND